MALPPNNPFSTCYIRPSAFEYIFHEESLDVLLDRLRKNDWQGQIIGRHGVGKSTLLASLLPHLKNAGRQIVFHALHNQPNERLPPAWKKANWDESTQVVLDGYEQLSWWGRRRLCRRCRKAGLLVTTHHDLGLPELCRLRPSLKLARKITSQLHSGPIPEQTLTRAYEQTQGDIREMLFQLYDWYEEQRFAGHPPTSVKST